MSLKSKALGIVLVTLTLLVVQSFAPVTAFGTVASCGLPQPRFDEIHYTTIRDVAMAVDEMKAGRLDFIPNVPETSMQLDLEALGFDISWCEMAEFGYFGVNCRDYQGDGAINQPLNYSCFRTALHYMFGYDRKDHHLGLIYGVAVPPLDTIVPYAQTEWCAANDPVPCYPGAYLGGPNNPMPTNPTLACQMLEDCGFTVEDSDADTKDELHNPDGTIVRQMTVWYSAGAPLLEQFVHAWITEVNNHFRDDCGVEEGPNDEVCGGLVYPFHPEPQEFGFLVTHMLVYFDFDIVRIGWTNLGRFPDWLYSMFHSSFAGMAAGEFFGYNYVGFVNDTCDALTYTIFTSLNRTAVLCATYMMQYHMLYEWNAYLVMNTGFDVGAYGHGGGAGGACTRWMEDWVTVPSYCSDTGYTWNQMHWKDNPTGECDGIIRRTSMPPSELTPWYSDELYEWNYLDRIYEGLIDINGKTLEDEPYVACDWNVTYWDTAETIPEPIRKRLYIVETGMRVTFWLKDDVYWQDGYKVTSEDVKANWDYMKKYEPSRYATTWGYYVYGETEGPYKCTAYINVTSLWLSYDYSGIALMFPKWVLHGLDKAIDDPADPWAITRPEDFKPWQVKYRQFADYCGVPYGPNIDPTTGKPIASPAGKMRDEMTMLIGTGAYYFDWYNSATEKGHMVKNTEFWSGRSELFCNIDASGDPDRPTGSELYERALYHQENDTSALFEIQVRNTCGNNITDVYVAASLDGYIFETKGPYEIKEFSHICVPFESPVVDICQHELDQKVFIGEPIPECEPVLLEPCQEVWFEPCTYVHWIEPGLVHIEQPTYIHVVEGEALVDGEPIPICEPYPLYPCQLVWFAPSTIVHWPTTPGHMHIEEPTVIHVLEGRAYIVCICCVGAKPVFWTRYFEKKDAWPDIGGMMVGHVMEKMTIPELTAKQTPLPDCKVDMKDVATAARAFGSVPIHPRWWAPADINSDFTVDMKDIAIIASQFGYPW